MASCHLCGQSIPKGGGIRKEVPTGHSVSSGGFVTSRGTVGLGGGEKISFGLRTVCQRCAGLVDKAKANVAKKEKNLLLRCLVYLAIGMALIFLAIHFKIGFQHV